MKLLWWTDDGQCLLSKRLERDRFIWPQATSGTVLLSQEQLSMLLEGRPERPGNHSQACERRIVPLNSAHAHCQLPNDIEALKALLLARDEEEAGLKAQLDTRAAEIEQLKLQVAKLRRVQFGRKSEKLDYQIEQLELQLEDLQADDA